MRRLIWLAALLITASNSPVMAWSETGHIVAVELAASRLGTERFELNRIAGELATQIDSGKRLYLIRNYEGISYLGQIASFPDAVRSRPLRELFDEFGDALPPALEKYADRDTSAWHYVNQSYVAEDYRQQCNLEGEVNLLTVLPDLEAGYHQASSDRDRALILAFIVHLVADASQPLHTLTRVFFDCRHDRGGNDFCASFRAGDERCETTLHQFWDRAAGLFDAERTLEQRIDALAAVDVPPAMADLEHPREWAELGMRQARFIYSLSINESPDRFYREEAQYRSERFLAYAAAWIETILQRLSETEPG